MTSQRHWIQSPGVSSTQCISLKWIVQILHMLCLVQDQVLVPIPTHIYVMIVETFLFYNLSGFGPFSYGSYFYDDNGLAILNNLQPQPPVGFNTPFNSYDIQWADTNKLCTVMDSSNVISSYIFDEGGILLIIIMFQISHLILILQLFYITMII